MAATTKKPAAKPASGKSTTAKKATSKSTGTKKTTTKSTAAKKTSTAKKPSDAKKPSTAKKPSSGTSVKLTATEKKLVELYRAANATTKKEAMEVLKNDQKPNDSLIEAVLQNKDLRKTIIELFGK